MKHFHETDGPFYNIIYVVDEIRNKMVNVGRSSVGTWLLDV